MGWRTSFFVIGARNIGRNVGVNKWIARIILRGRYEEKYDECVTSLMVPGDCVWDIGANVGFYTKSFAHLVGDAGRVYAFEPSQSNFRRLKEETADLGNVVALELGLGREDAKLSLKQGEDELGATSRVVDGDEAGTLVNIRAGESLIRDDGVKPPNVVKIDVEGFEYEVLEGMRDQLASPSLRAVGVEVHFGILRERGMGNVPQQIESLLRVNGFDVKWPDSSHIVAHRPR